MCEHLHDQTSRYDPVAKTLTFLLVCPRCETEEVVESLRYEPRFKPCVGLPSRNQSPPIHTPVTEQLQVAA
jgi:hypothetical protein